MSRTKLFAAALSLFAMTGAGMALSSAATPASCAALCGGACCSGGGGCPHCECTSCADCVCCDFGKADCCADGVCGIAAHAAAKTCCAKK